MIVDNILEILNFCQVYLKISPILLNNLIAQVINQPPDEAKHFLRQQVRFFKTTNIRTLHPLQILPNTIKLPLYKLTPE